MRCKGNFANRIPKATWYSMYMTSLIGVDLGGTKIAIARFDAKTLEVQFQKTLPTHAEQRLPKVYEDMRDLIRDCIQPDTTSIGVGVPGLVRHPEGILVRMPNIPGSENFPLLDTLKKDCQLPVCVENDASCFAYAESQLGAGKGASVFVGITMGTGVGGGIVIDGKLFRGAHGYAAEIGHMLLQPGMPPYDTADKRGDVEQFLSGTAMGKRCEAAGKPEDYLEGAVCAFMRPEIFREIAWMCVNICHSLDPEVIAFGGSAGRALKPHLKAIEKELGKWMLPGTPPPKLSTASLPNAATLGAALLSQQS